jgi:hypothetical protein
MPDNQFWRDASGRLTFGMFRPPADSYLAVRDSIVTTFHLSPHNALVSNGVDIVFQDFQRGDQIVGLEWDNWTGFTLVAKNPASETLVQDIATWLLQSHWASMSSDGELGTAPKSTPG